MLNDNEKMTNYETLKHINRVRDIIGIIAKSLIDAASMHDRSKLEPPELDIFVEYTPKLKGATYMSDEYKRYLKEMKPALDHHRSNNRHHPEYFENGINGMTLVDLLEMLCDWTAATERHDDGDIRKSIDINADRFGIDQQLVQILHNTVDMLEMKNET